jgi:hypothetical protein
VLFGAGLVDGRPDPALQMRLDRVSQLYHAGWAPRVVCSGGEPELAAMLRELTAAGIPREALIRDPTGLNTRATVRAVRSLGADRWERVIVVSSSYHMRRILSECRRQGVRAHPGRPDPMRPWWRLWVVVSPWRARHILREMMAIWWYALPRPSLDEVQNLFRASVNGGAMRSRAIARAERAGVRRFAHARVRS